MLILWKISANILKPRFSLCVIVYIYARNILCIGYWWCNRLVLQGPDSWEPVSVLYQLSLLSEWTASQEYAFFSNYLSQYSCIPRKIEMTMYCCFGTRYIKLDFFLLTLIVNFPLHLCFWPRCQMELFVQDCYTQYHVSTGTVNRSKLIYLSLLD